MADFDEKFDDLWMDDGSGINTDSADTVAKTVSEEDYTRVACDKPAPAVSFEPEFSDEPRYIQPTVTVATLERGTAQFHGNLEEMIEIKPDPEPEPKKLNRFVRFFKSFGYFFAKPIRPFYTSLSGRSASDKAKIFFAGLLFIPLLIVGWTPLFFLWLYITAATIVFNIFYGIAKIRFLGRIALAIVIPFLTKTIKMLTSGYGFDFNRFDAEFWHIENSWVARFFILNLIGVLLFVFMAPLFRLIMRGLDNEDGVKYYWAKKVASLMKGIVYIAFGTTAVVFNRRIDKTLLNVADDNNVPFYWLSLRIALACSYAEADERGIKHL